MRFSRLYIDEFLEKNKIKMRISYHFVKKFIRTRKYKKRNMDILSNPKIYPKVGLILDLNFHLSNKWTVSVTPYLINAIIKELNCIIIQNQKDYDKYKNDLDVIIAGEPGRRAPHIKYVKNKPRLKYASMSDPHSKTVEWQNYFLENDFSYTLAYYYHPTIFYLRKIPKDKIIHWPWAIPDQFIDEKEVKIRNQNYILIFGAAKGEAYETRNWCKSFNFVKSMNYSGVENKVLFGEEYFKWLSKYDAVVAATSLDLSWRYVVAKYFEIASAGGLLFAQEAEDLKPLGFEDNRNCIIFNKENFEVLARAYLTNKEAYVDIREEGRNLILKRHTLSKRISFLKKHIMNHL